TIEKAKENLGMYQRRTILFIDEIHRFNKSQQDALLPAVEDGTVVMVGATTENPYFEVNAPLVSRSRIFQLKRLDESAIVRLLERALTDEKKGLGEKNIEIEENGLLHLAQLSNGDARSALNSLELAVLTTPENKEGKIVLDQNIIEDSIQKRVIHYDKDGHQHYDNISAFIKSIRGSDPDAALYWMAKMLWAGEDPKFIARRIIIAASEDVGNANPNALTVALNAFHAVEIIGLPEARIVLSQAVTYLASSPKSNASYKAINQALSDVREKRTYEVPAHLRDAHYSGAKEFGHGEGYKYPHSYDNHYVKQSYLPKELEDRVYYQPEEIGEEIHLKQYLEETKYKHKG
ncbi:MAG TPA: hypothetical protein DHN33_00825, partial [Eubacteriaceae bacterium]|nr:hypothetical protein [Eubacteriaceae bacterium]